MKIAINRSFGGFSLSAAAVERLKQLTGNQSITARSYAEETLRSDPVLIQVLEELGSAADGRFAHIGIVDVPDHVKWSIHSYDGLESVEEEHESWT